MSKPSVGNYYIVHTKSDAHGNPLAVTYNGEHAVVTVAIWDKHDKNQMWTIKDDVGWRTQAISPECNPRWQVAFGSTPDTIQVLPEGGYVWMIKGDEVYSIRSVAAWSLHEYVSGENISYFYKSADAERQKWKLIPCTT